MRKRILSLLLCCVMLIGLLPTAAFAADTGKGIQLGASGISGYDSTTGYASDFVDIDLTVGYQEQFTLTPGGRYYFDLSAMNIPGKVNGRLPDSTLHYVPFTYAGTIEAYKLTSEMATTEEYAQREKYPHSLFIADFAVTNDVSWDALNTAGLIFGKDYAAGGVDYTLRAPSVGSGYTGSDDSERGTPQSNEWDAILDKANQDWKDNTSGYIKNWSDKYSFGQDNYADASYRAFRGCYSARYWYLNFATLSFPYLGFRPVLEVLNSDTLGSDGMKVVTLDLNGGKLGGSSDAIQIIVKNGSEFTAPASDGLTRPDENTDSYFMWLGSNGKLYAPGDSVPADVTKLTAQFALSEQFFLTPGGRYYFDLSGANIPGTANGSLPDTTLHYVPFTYAGTIEAYKLTSATATTEEYAQQNKYAHSLFVADYAVTHKVNWNNLDTASLIFGKNYASGGVDYTLRAPSVGSNSTGSGDSQRGVPQSNEWDTMLNKNSGYIQNWNEMYSWGQDAYSTLRRAIRGYNSARTWNDDNATHSYPLLGFRPVLEVLNPDTLGSDGLKVVTLDLNGGKLGGSSDAIQIIVKTGSEFTAPASGGLTRPDGDTGNFFMWRGSNGKFYVPGDSVPADVTTLTVQWTAPTYAVTLNTNGGTINSGNVTSYTYGVGATLPTAGDMTYTGHTFVGWYDNENLTGSPVTAIGNTETGNKEYWAKWEANTYTVTLNTNGGTINNGNVTGYTYGQGATLPTADDMTYTGHTFKGWYDNENLTGSPVTAISDTETGNKEYWAKWEANAYTVTLNTNGGTINSGNVTSYTYGVGATLPTAGDMTYTGHTFVGWYDNENLTGSPVTAIGGTETGNKEYWAKWEINQYTITVKPENGKADITITQDYGTPITAPADPTREGYTFMGWDTEIPTTMPAENITLKAKWKDIEKPTGEIVIGTNKWQEFLNKITFGLFFKDTQTVTINAADNSGTVFVSYLVTDQDLSEAELQSLVFSGYEEPFRIDPNGEYIVYAMLVDESLNITYLRSDRVTLDNVQPVIGGIENGKTYCEAQTVTIDEKYVDTVTVNGTEVTLDENNSFVLSPADGEQKIIVTDKAGNTAEMTVTVNDGHTGGTATCTERAVCEICGKAYGDLDGNHHANLKHIDAKAATKTAGGNIEYWYCEDCDKYFADAAATKEIKQADTVTAKLSGAAKSPQTGGDSGVVTVLLLSGGAFICLVSRRKKRTHTV